MMELDRESADEGWSGFAEQWNEVDEAYLDFVVDKQNDLISGEPVPLIRQKYWEATTTNYEQTLTWWSDIDLHLHT